MSRKTCCKRSAVVGPPGPPGLPGQAGTPGTPGSNVPLISQLRFSGFQNESSLIVSPDGGFLVGEGTYNFINESLPPPTTGWTSVTTPIFPPLINYFAGTLTALMITFATAPFNQQATTSQDYYVELVRRTSNDPINQYTRFTPNVKVLFTVPDPTISTQVTSSATVPPGILLQSGDLLALLVYPAADYTPPGGPQLQVSGVAIVTTNFG